MTLLQPQDLNWACKKDHRDFLQGPVVTEGGQEF